MIKIKNYMYVMKYYERIFLTVTKLFQKKKILLL